MQIAPGLHLCLSGGNGFSLSDAFDCSAFAVETRDGLLLFDAGAGRDGTATAERLAQLPGPVRSLFLTHAHADHSGGAAEVRRRGARVVAGAQTARIVSSGDEVAMSLQAARRAGGYPDDYRFEPCPVDTIMADGERCGFGDVSVEAIATPGHSADHQSYLVVTPTLRVLITGDALFANGRVVLQDTWDCNVPHTCSSIRRLDEIAFDAFLPGHGAFSLVDGRRHVAAALARIDRLLCPELFV